MIKGDKKFDNRNKFIFLKFVFCWINLKIIVCFYILWNIVFWFGWWFLGKFMYFKGFEIGKIIISNER